MRPRRATADGAVQRTAALERLRWDLRAHFADQSGAGLRGAWADEDGSTVCGYYQRPPKRSLSGDPERFVALNGILVAEDDAAPSQFSKLWLDHCQSADDQLN